MTERYPTAYRSTTAGTLRGADAGQEVRLAGWVHRRRDLGSLVFFDLRDRTGLVQISFDPAWTPADVLANARKLGPEDVVTVRGRVERRPAGQENPDRATGEVELRATELQVLSHAEAPPIPVARTPEDEPPAEDLRLRYRYLDLRRPELQRNFLSRHRAAQAVRRFLSAEGFWEVETPMLTRRTPEGARDYLVPSRVHPGEFYALPQSPQLYKQLLMVSGFDRYFQIARCLRDEDLRADRQPEFTQIDAEMAFVDEEDVFRVGEGLMAAVWQEVLGIELPLPFPRIPFAEALARYGTDKPDLRFDLPIIDVTDTLGRSAWGLIARARETGERLRGIRIPGGAELSRRELDELQEVARRGGAPGVLWTKRTENGYAGGPLAKAFPELPDDAPFLEQTGLQAGDLFVLIIGHFRSAEGGGLSSGAPMEPALDELRRFFGRRMELVGEHQHAWLWVTDFPLFEWDAAEGLVAAHHPFTMPHPDDIPALLDATGGSGPINRDTARSLAERPVRSRAYDAVYNGHELASGSVRIHDSELQQRVFKALGIGSEEARAKFGFLLEAFRFGAPPHAGFAFGFDRLVMLLAGATSLREVIAYPKTTSARALFEGAPSPVDSGELRELHLRSAEAAGEQIPGREE